MRGQRSVPARVAEMLPALTDMVAILQSVFSKNSATPFQVHLPCGYTPRAKTLSQNGITYYGLDLPAAIAEAEPAILSIIDEDKRSAVHFCGVDATNGESLKKALKDAEGPLCITTEGLLMYFSDFEAGALCDNIRMLLKEHGGYWLTSDPEASLQYLLTLQPIAGERFKEILMQSLSRVQDKSDVSVGKNQYIWTL